MAVNSCRICTSPFVADIDRAKKDEIEQYIIVKNFYPLFNNMNLYSSPHSMTQAISRHFRKRHHKKKIITEIGLSYINPDLQKEIDGQKVRPPQAEPEEADTTPMSVDDYAQTLLEKGMSAEVMRKMTPAMVIQVHRFLLERDKIKKESNVLVQVMKKFMSGLVTKEDEVETAKMLEGEEANAPALTA